MGGLKLVGSSHMHPTFPYDRDGLRSPSTRGEKDGLEPRRPCSHGNDVDGNVAQTLVSTEGHKSRTLSISKEAGRPGRFKHDILI